jgi:hypothetical protein
MDKHRTAAHLPTSCPSCQHGLSVARLKCLACGTQLEGEFALPLVMTLPAEDLGFLVEFVKASGSLKEIARRRGQSYPTVRNRLNDVIARLEESGPSALEKQRAILDAIAKGKISVAEGAKRLREVKA